MNREQVLEQEQVRDPAMLANSQSQINIFVPQGTITWTGPLLLLVGRSALMFVAQGLVAGILELLGSSTPWLSAGAWWTVYGTMVDLGCLMLMWTFTRREGIRLRDLLALFAAVATWF